MNAVYALYSFACIGLVYFVYRSEALDFRGVGRLSRRPVERPGSSEEDDYVDPAEAADEAHSLSRELRRLARFEIEPRADFTLLLTLAGAGALLFGAAFLFLLPLGFEAASGDYATASVGAVSAPRGPTDLAELSYAAERPMARLAQIVGAVCGAAIALRMLRIFMGLAVLAAAVLLILMAVNFVIGRPTLALFGG